jgi:uncharacterized protein YcbX
LTFRQVGSVAGPWAAAASSHLDRDVVLARVHRPGGVVYGAPVSIVTSASLQDLSARLGRPVDGAELEIGQARVRVHGPVTRCAVIDLDPVTGARNARVLQSLAGAPGAGDTVRVR